MITVAFGPRSLALLALSAVLFACGPAGDPPAEPPRSPFFDLKDFFEREVDRLETEAPAVSKTVSFGDSTATRRFEKVDFRRELKVFLDADINRPAWWDRYAIDSVRRNGALDSIRYRALDEKLKIREVVLGFEGDSLREVRIDLRAKSLATEFSQQLYYAPGRSYRIDTYQDVVLSPERSMNVEGRFLP